MFLPWSVTCFFPLQRLNQRIHTYLLAVPQRSTRELLTHLRPSDRICQGLNVYNMKKYIYKKKHQFSLCRTVLFIFLGYTH